MQCSQQQLQRAAWPSGLCRPQRQHRRRSCAQHQRLRLTPPCARPWDRPCGSGQNQQGSSGGGSAQRRIAVAAAQAGDRGEPVAAGLAQLGAQLDALVRFSRPHTMLGTLVSIVSVSLLAMQSFAWSGAAALGLAQALVPALLMNVAIVGINQLSDVEIDKVNKPYLPLASGEWSRATGASVVAVCAAAALALGLASGSPPLLATLVGSLLLGVLYSTELPLMRWKRSPWLAALCILAVRAVAVQLGFFCHMQRALGVAPPPGGLLALLAGSRPLSFTVAFMLAFSVVIALFKDIPDVKGDSAAGVATFSVRHGPAAVFWVCTCLLLAAYVGGIAFAATSPPGWSRLLVGAGHACLAALLLARSRAVNTARKGELAAHYMFVWKLFYAEYLLIPFLQ